MNDLHELLHDAVDGIEPDDRLAEIRARTAGSERAAARPWFYAAGAAVLATAAAVAIVAVLGDGPSEPGPAHDHHHAVDPSGPSTLVPAYFLADGTQGSGLYREFDRVPAGDHLQGALDRIQRPPADPDYQTTWPAGTLTTVTLGDGTIDVGVGDEPLVYGADDFPVQQVVYTLQGTLGERLPVRFVRDGEVVLGPVEAAPEAEVLNPVSISDPAEGSSYDGSLVARGRARSFGGTIPWTLLRGEVVVRSGTVAAAAGGDTLTPWEVSVDLTDVPPGRYTFVVTEDQGPGGAGAEPRSDTRTIVVR